MPLHRYQAWKDPENDLIAYWRTDYGPRPPNVSGKAELLWEFEASTGEEAMSIHFLRLGWAPYNVEGPAEECPKCEALFYPLGFGECWRCGHKQ